MSAAGVPVRVDIPVNINVGGVGAVGAAQTSMPTGSTFRGPVGGMTALATDTDRATGSMNRLGLATNQTEGRFMSLSRGLRRARGQMLGFFFSTLFLTMGMQRLNKAQKDVVEAEKEFGKGSDEAKEAAGRYKEMLVLVQIQQAFLGVQIANTTVDLIANRAAIRAGITALFARTTAVAAATTVEGANTVSKSLNTIALNSRNTALAISSPLVVTESGLMAANTVATNVNTASKIANFGARAALLTIATLGVGAALVGGALLAGSAAKTSLESDLPSFQTFSGESKLVPRDMPIFAHAGEIVSRPSSGTGTSKSNGGNTIVMNNTFTLATRGNSPEKVVNDLLKKATREFRGSYKV